MVFKKLYPLISRAKHHPIYQKSHWSNKLVVILGWAGSQPKNYKKILDYYKSKNASVLLQIMPPFSLHAVRDYFEDRITHNLQKHMDEHKGCKIHLHIFSNNGSWAYGGLLDKGVLHNPESIIFDSAPYLPYNEVSDADIEQFSIGMTSLLLNAPVYYQFPLTPFLRVSLRWFTNTIFFFTRVQGNLKIATDYLAIHRTLRDKFPVKSKVCFVYSSGDAMMPTSAIQRFKNELEAKGVKCSEKLYGDDVQHTGAFFKYTEEYCKLLDDFVFASEEKQEKMIEKDEKHETEK